LNIKTSFPTPIPSIEIEPLLLIPLVENAFKHSVYPGKESVIDISLKVSSKQLIFEVVNSNHPKNSNDRSVSGIGLQNLTKRLNHLYPNNYTLTISEKDDLFIAHLTLNL